MSFENYLVKFTKETEYYQTHLSFTGGKYNVKDNDYDNESQLLGCGSSLKNDSIF